MRRVTVLRCILLLFLPFPVLLFLFSFPHLVLVPRYGEITMKAFRPSPFTGDMHTERRIFGIASRCGTFGTRHTEMVLSARQAFQPPHIICMFFARHIQLCFRLSQVARPLGRGVHRQEEELRNTNVRRSADCTFRRARAMSIHSASGSFLSAFLPEKDGWAFLGGCSWRNKLRLRTRK